MKNTQTMMHMLSTKVPKTIWDGMEHTSNTTGLSKTDQVRMALASYLGIQDLREPFIPQVKKQSAINRT